MGSKVTIHPLNFFLGKPKNELEWAAHHARNAYYSEYLKQVELRGVPKKPMRYKLDERGGYEIEEI